MKNKENKLSRSNKLRVAAYCRVSTRQEEQDNSLNYQKEYYHNLITSNENWEFVGIYADVASGTNQSKRKQFNDMIKDCKKNKIDLIIVKSVSRFGRNTVESLKTTRKLREWGVDVYFEVEKISLKQMGSETILALLFAFAQEESEDRSGAIKWGIHTGFRLGHSKFADKVCFGYKKDENGRLIIDEDKATVVEEIFSLYLQGNSLRKIVDKLHERGILTPTGKENWTPMAISKILTNEKYTGDVILQKTYIKDFYTHTQVTNDTQLTKYLYKNNNPPIISKELFEQVQKLMGNRSNVEITDDGRQIRKATRCSSNNSLSGKIKCQICGKNFRRITTHSGEIVWRCAGRVEKCKTKCTARTVKQSELIEIINQEATITDLHLDFLIEYIDFIEVDDFEIKVSFKEINASTKTNLLHKQDHWLVQHSISGDVIAKETLYSKHYELLRKHLRYYQGQYHLNNMDIDDMEQNIWLKIYSNLESYNSQYRFWSWMRQLLRAELQRLCKHGKRYLISEESVRIQSDKNQFSTSNDIDKWISDEYIRSLIAVLTEREREILIRYLYKEETQLTISKDLGVTHQRVNQIYLQALEKIANCKNLNIKCAKD